MVKLAEPQHAPNRHQSAAPIGLDAGREHAQRRFRRRQRINRLKIFVVALVGLGVLSAAGYVGWQVYEDERAKEDQLRLENQTNMNPREAIDILEESPRWNGPGNPTFGVGNEP